MSNYIIEDNINFYDELYKSLDNDDTNKDDDSEMKELCLITNEPLIHHFVKLSCNHTFNYLPIFKYLVNYRTTFWSMDNVVLPYNEIICPYCRTREKNVLPYYEDMGLDKIQGINSYDPSFCCASTSCNRSYNLKIFGGDNKYYCSSHYGIVEYKYQKMIDKEKKKQMAKQTVLDKKKAAKNTPKQEKDAAKIQEKLAKQSLKKQFDNTNTNSHVDTSENTLNAILTNILAGTCKQIIKSGMNKGKRCGCKVKKDGYCLRHQSSHSIFNINENNLNLNENTIISDTIQLTENNVPLPQMDNNNLISEIIDNNDNSNNIHTQDNIDIVDNSMPENICCHIYKSGSKKGKKCSFKAKKNGWCLYHLPK